MFLCHSRCKYTKSKAINSVVVIPVQITVVGTGVLEVKERCFRRGKDGFIPKHSEGVLYYNRVAVLVNLLC